VEVIEVGQQVEQLAPSSGPQKAVKQFVLPPSFQPVSLEELSQTMPATHLHLWIFDVPPLNGAPDARRAELPDPVYFEASLTKNAQEPRPFERQRLQPAAPMKACAKHAAGGKGDSEPTDRSGEPAQGTTIRTLRARAVRSTGA
jgi:hypothetical protein